MSKEVIEKLQEGKQDVKVCRSTREAVLFVKEVLNA